MLRLPQFTYLQPASLAEALRMKADAGPDGSYVAGGTDLYPNMKRRHQTPTTVISLMGIEELRGVRNAKRGTAVGAAITLTELHTLRERYPAVATAAELATPPSTILASTIVPRSHRTHAATPSTGKSKEPRRRSLW